MSDESLPQLTEAPIPAQTHILRLEERIAKGKALRDVAARNVQGEWKPPANRPDPVDILIENSKGRVEELLPIRYGRMMVSPFTFYRGAAAVMAYDLAHTPSTGLSVLADGDCHLMNFGGFATAERKVIFDLNDFDEASFAPWEWDVKRLAASFVVAGRSNGFAAADCREAAWLAAGSYRQRMAEYAGMPVLQVWNDAFDFDDIVAGMTDKDMKRFYSKKLTSTAEQSAHEKEFAKLTFQAGATPRIVDQPPLIYHFGDQRDQEMRKVAEKTLVGYRKTLIPARRLLLDRFEVVDYAIKVVGVGSVGTFCGILLLMSGNGDPLFLQFKEARQSVLEPYCGASPFGHAGQRVVAGQRAMQAASDIFLGWATGAGAAKRHFFLRQLSDAKIKPVVEIMKATNLKNFARLCGMALARAHARSGDAAVLTGYMGKSTAFEDALADFSVAYADQTERDHAALVAAVRSGRIEAYTEPVSKEPTMKPRSLAAFLLSLGVVVLSFLLGPTSPTAAQDQPGRTQQIAERLQAGEAHAFRLKDLQSGDRLAVSMRAASGNLDPAIGIMDTTAPLAETMIRYRADLQTLLAGDENVAQALDELRNRYFLAWDDDSGDGYAAALEYVVPAAGDYVLIASSSLSALGRATSGDYDLLIGLNAQDGAAAPAGAEPAGAPIAERIPGAWGLSPSVEEVTGALTTDTPSATLQLVDIDAGQTLTAYVEATSGNLIPMVALRDYGGKALEAGNLGGQDPQAALEYTLTENAAGYTLEVRAGALPDGTATEGEYRVLVGVNAPDVMTGQSQAQGNKVLETPIEVQTGLRVLRISEVDSPNENFNVVASFRMDWTDPALAFSPDSCNCSVKLYTDKEVDRFLIDVGSRWPAFTFFNQLGNRWIQNRAAAIWPDGRARYAESFNTTFQADFDFRQYPFDTQTFPIFLDLLLPTSEFRMVELPGYSLIDPAHGEDEFIVSDLTVAASTVTPSAADTPVSRLTFSFSAPRHLNYYLLQVFLPILLIILISWFTFFLRDYTRRIEAAGANILLFIAFSWSLADNYPRLGYLTFLDAIMSVTFAVNVLVLLYNVYMKRLENQGKDERVQRIDNILDWAYPLTYAVLIGVVVLVFF